MVTMERCRVWGGQVVGQVTVSGTRYLLGTDTSEMRWVEQVIVQDGPSGALRPDLTHDQGTILETT